MSGVVGCATARPLVQPCSATDPDPFAHAEDIVGVSPLKVATPGFPAHVPHYELVGAIVALRAVDGMSEQRLQQLVDCHHPLGLPGVEARVTTDGARFLVALRASGASTAREVLARARLLTPGVSQ